MIFLITFNLLFAEFFSRSWDHQTIQRSVLTASDSATSRLQSTEIDVFWLLKFYVWNNFLCIKTLVSICRSCWPYHLYYSVLWYVKEYLLPADFKLLWCSDDVLYSNWNHTTCYQIFSFICCYFLITSVIFLWLVTRCCSILVYTWMFLRISSRF